MARKRMIDPNIWNSEDFSKLTPLAKLVFVGLFSNADDEGRGRAKAVYVRNILFPYDEKIEVIDIDTALNEISSNMSVTFYSHNENEYYVLDNWNIWQRVDKPQNSKIPLLDDDSKIIRRTVAEQSPNTPRTISPNRIEENRTEEKGIEEGMVPDKPSHRFIPPTLEEVKAYCEERKNNVDPEHFLAYYTARGWILTNGKKAVDWKSCVVTFEKNNKKFGNKDSPSKNKTQEQEPEIELKGIRRTYG